MFLKSMINIGMKIVYNVLCVDALYSTLASIRIQNSFVGLIIDGELKIVLFLFSYCVLKTEC